jgi:membrane protease YdiL (CAAX protease family)
MNEPTDPQSPLPLHSAPLEPRAVGPLSEPEAEPPAHTAVIHNQPIIGKTERSNLRVWGMCAVAILAFGAFFILMVVLGGEFREFASAGLESFPFAILAVLAYASNPKGFGGKALTLTYWILLVGAVGITSLAMTSAVVLQLKVGRDSVVPPPNSGQILRILAAALALVTAGGVGLLCFTPWLRRRAATRFNVEAESFVHATALATTTTMTFMCVVPLLATHIPLTEWLFNPQSGLNFNGSEFTVSSMLYGLLWAVPASFIAVGFPIKRTLREAQQRLSLVLPNRRQVVIGIVVALFLALASGPVNFLIGALWKALGLPITDTHTVEALFKNAITPAGAVIVGLSAGLGEELVFRGVLLPRLGIVLPALLFTSLHAFQYNFDALIWIFILGVILGFARRKTNTSTCVLIHGTYDLVLLLAAYLWGSTP